MPLIKVCGVRRVEDVQAADALGIAAIGLNFAPESPRFIGSVDAACRLVEASRVQARLAGVFVNAERALILDAVRAARLTIVQLHGDEPPAFASDLRAALPAGVQLWKAFRVSDAGDLAPLAGYPCDGWLLDAKVRGARGGSGQSFDWNILGGLQRNRTLILAGGITPENAAEAARRVRPDWIDTASGVESAPGVKDAGKMKALVEALKPEHRPQT